jgi:hypothetical protein
MYAVFAVVYGITGLREMLTQSEDKSTGYIRLPQ